MRVAVVGAGWAGLAAAIEATQAGHQVSLLEASRHLGGRARALPLPPLHQQAAQDAAVVVDNGQHILIGAYRETLRLLALVGVDSTQVLLRQPLTLEFPDGRGLRLPAWPSPLDAVAGIARARGWGLAAKWSLLRAALVWQAQKFQCAPEITVAQLCAEVHPQVLQSLIEPLCVAALNTPANAASGQVFLRVLQDSLFGGAGASNLLLPRTDLGRLFPQPAQRWLQARGAQVVLGARVLGLQEANGWQLQYTSTGATDGAVTTASFDAVIWATAAAQAAQVLRSAHSQFGAASASAVARWADTVDALRYESIATVYLMAPGVRLSHPMLALASDSNFPAQFVFDRGQLGGPSGLLALVVSASVDTRAQLTDKVLRQAQTQLAVALQGCTPYHVQTVVEKHATFACTPALVRPRMAIAAGLQACGDYVAGPYPATLEGALRSGTMAARGLVQEAATATAENRSQD